MSEKKIKQLKVNRTVLIGQQGRIKEFLNGDRIASASLEELQVRLSAIEQYYDRFNMTQSALEELDETECDGTTRSTFEEQYFVLRPTLEVLINSKRLKKIDQNQTIDTCVTSAVKLPVIEIPTFNGDYTKWSSFYDTFKKLVHNNEALDDNTRFIYLNSSLEGSAQKTIEAMESNSKNYKSALEILENRYNNRRIIAQEHIKQLFFFTPRNKDVASSIRELIDTFKAHLRALAALDRPTAQWDDLIVFLILSKLDPSIVEKWEDSNCPSDRLPALDELYQFLEKKFRSIESRTDTKLQTFCLANSKRSTSQPSKRGVHLSATTAIASTKCAFCADSYHSIYKCSKFLSLQPLARFEAVKGLKLCVNCLKPAHAIANCQSSGCRKCSKSHNTLLHFEQRQQSRASSTNAQQHRSARNSDPVGDTSQKQPSVSSRPSTNDNPSVSSRPSTNDNPSGGSCNSIQSPSFVSHTVPNENINSQILLATALIDVLDSYGNSISCRALLDSGSQLHFISEATANKLCLDRQRFSMPISGIGGVEVQSKEKTRITLRSRVTAYKWDIDTFILPHLGDHQPTSSFNVSNWNIPNHIELADPTFFSSNSIDILLGAEIYFDLLLQGQIRLTNNSILQNTVLGWIVTGKVLSQLTPRAHCKLATSAPTTSTLEQLVKSFWEVERHDAPDKTMSHEDYLCETHFLRTYRRSSTGQFIVKLPFREDPERLGNSLNIASRRFYRLEKKIALNPELSNAYNEFMQEYESLSHMELLDPTNIPALHYYLPHHGVEKPDSSSTKLRVVFDGSSKTTTGRSINSLLMTGPTIQPELFSTIVRFRSYRYVFTADISKMYRQILLDPADRRFQLILWRNSQDTELRTYQLNTVTYGMSSSSYLATRCLFQLADEEGRLFPLAAQVIRRDMYVDDCMTGADTLSEAKHIQGELISLLNRGHFELRKFCANDSALLNDIPIDHREQMLSIQKNEVVKTLGLIWQPDDDVFRFNIKVKDTDDITKRTVLAELASIFDPLGLVGPVVVMGKLFLQGLWKDNTRSWDTQLSTEECQQWRTFRANIADLNLFKIPRHMVSTNKSANIELHAFSDASEAAYGTCCYLRSIDEFGSITVRLICSKSRVSPIKTTSIPRLELCAALMMVELVERLLNFLPFIIDNVFYYTDSTIVLAWLCKPSYSWTTFVANRVAKIQDATRTDQWRHVASKQNPADYVSRGMTAKLLYEAPMWLNGPSFIFDAKKDWPVLPQNDIDIPERRGIKSVLFSIQMTCNLMERIRHGNSLLRLKLIFGYLYRFIHNCRLKKEDRMVETKLNNAELDNGLTYLLRNIQQTSFADEYRDLIKGKQVSKGSPLRHLSPFLDESKLIRVGGRLRNSSLDYNSKHQVLIPKNHLFTNILISFFHSSFMHAGPQALLAITRQMYWPIDGVRTTRKIVNRCIRCFRVKPQTMQHIMGDLPQPRITPARPFLVTGIDFCGPFNCHYKVRGKPPTKAYVAVFICFATKATHLELVSDLSSAAFINALERFISRRGMCTTIYCDNATNFVGARSELDQLNRLFKSQEHQDAIYRWCEKDHITWKPIPPRSPHFGGLWEAAVKAFKHHFYRAAANCKLTYEELHTIVTKIEAVLNSRPITPLSSDPNDMEALTPGHYLIGEPLTSFSSPDYTSISHSRLGKFRGMQQLYQHFWKRWSAEYLQQLQLRKKWMSKTENLKIGTLVLIRDDNLPPLKWMMGRIIDVFPGSDGIIRVAEVKTKTGTYRRAAVKLCPLPIDQKNDDSNDLA